jgi:glycine/D-amino acid oxidase-like deaminating enzyme
MTHEVVILGGGCSGLWLLYELCPDYRCLLVEHQQLGRFASTRNQSWLHSGALYSVFLAHNELREKAGSPEALIRLSEECRKAFEDLRDFCPEAFEADSECLFLFDSEKEAVKAAEKIHNLGLPVDRLHPADIVAREPVLSPLAICQYGLATQDIPFDSHRILSKLVQESRSRGAEFHSTRANLYELEITFNDGLWTVRDGGEVVAEAPVLVCAAGALIRRIMNHILTKDSVLTLNKCLVAVLHDRICNRIIAVRGDTARGLNLVPFEGGTTVNLGELDRKTREFGDDSFHVGKIPGKQPDEYQEIAEILNEFVPGLKLRSCQAHFYVCQKVSNPDHSSHPATAFGTRHYFWLTGDNKCFFLYAGKFTLARSAAIAFAQHLKRIVEMPEQPKTGFVQAINSPIIAPRPYYAGATHVLKLSDKGELEFEDVRG